jgi:hypothetical protein
MNLTSQRTCVGATCLDNTRKDALALGTTLEDTHNASRLTEIEQVIAYLVTLDHVLACQTHLNELHESHTSNNFKGQRIINEARQLRICESIKSVIDKFASTEVQRNQLFPPLRISLGPSGRI